MKVRQATIDDLSQLKYLYYQLLLFEKQFESALSPAYAMSDNATDFLTDVCSTEGPLLGYVLEDDAGEIGGYGVLFEISTLDTKHLGGLKFFHINTLFVSEKYRGQGNGRLLMNALEKVAKERGGERISVEFIKANTHAGNVYEAAGFRGKLTTMQKSIVAE